MSIKLEGIEFNKLKVAALFASQDRARFTLCGVCVERASSSAVRFIATDGKRMAILLQERLNDLPDFERFIIPTSLIKRAKAEVKKQLINLTFSPHTRMLEARIEGAQGCAFCCKSIDGVYANWLGAVPDKNAELLSSGVFSANSKYLPAFIEAAKTLGVEDSGLVLTPYSNGKDGCGAILVKIGGRNDFLGIIMPMRLPTGTPPVCGPDWVRAPEEALKEAEALEAAAKTIKGIEEWEGEK